jgi:uncharacterized protein (TIGR02246 family)
MKRCLLLTLAGLAIGFVLPTLAQQTDTADPQLREQIVALFGKFTEAWNNNDSAALAALYTKDAVFCGGEGSGPHYGREAIEKHFAEGFKLFHFSNHVVTPDQYSPHVIATAGNEAWVLGEWSMTIQSKNGGGPMQIKGNSLNIFVRDGDSWKARAILTNNAALAPEPAKTK